MRASAAAHARRVSASWQTDITDVAQMARLRARIVWSIGVLGILALGASVVFSPQTYTHHSWLIPASTALGLVIMAAWAAVRGGRMGDGEFVALIAVGQAFAGVAVAANQGNGQVARTALSLVEATVMGALFIERRPFVAVQPVVAVAILLAVSRTAPASSGAGVDVCIGAFSLIVVAGVIRLLRELAITALRQARLGEVTDPLTGLANRRGLERAGAERWGRSARRGLPVAVLVIDVDHFKRINDVRGHAGGDNVLRRLAEVITSTIRSGDVAVRLGGEEFLVLAGAPAGQAHILAERIRATVERELAPVTVSIGVHESVPADTDVLPTSIWSAVVLADRALYVAKNGGRNRVVSSGPPLT